jgi:hypothetical protein
MGLFYYKARIFASTGAFSDCADPLRTGDHVQEAAGAGVYVCWPHGAGAQREHGLRDALARQGWPLRHHALRAAAARRRLCSNCHTVRLGQGSASNLRYLIEVHEG